MTALRIIRNDLVILLREPVFAATNVVMPVLVLLFLQTSFRATLVADGYEDANGVEQALPGVIVLFSFFLVANFAFAVYREHTWNTWSRLLSLPSARWQIFVAKTVVPFMLMALQTAVLLAVGALFLDFDPKGGWFPILAVLVAYLVCLGGLGLVLLAYSKSMLQVTGFTNVAAILFAGLGGALAPISTLPDVAQSIARAFPSYWAMRGLAGSSLGDDASVAVTSVIVLSAMAAVLLTIAVMRIRLLEPKQKLY